MLAVERNVLTVFYPVKVPCMRGYNGPQREFITEENPEHSLIDHHGNGRDGTDSPHSHLKFIGIKVIEPEFLEKMLKYLNFSDEQRRQILQSYNEYFHQSTIMALLPPQSNDSALTVRLIQAYEDNERERILERTLQEMEAAESTTTSSSTQDSTQAALEGILERTLLDIDIEAATTFVALIALLIATGSIG